MKNPLLYLSARAERGREAMIVKCAVTIRAVLDVDIGSGGSGVRIQFIDFIAGAAGPGVTILSICGEFSEEADVMSQVCPATDFYFRRFARVEGQVLDLAVSK